MDGGRRQTDAAWLEMRDRGGPLVMIASVRGVPDLFFLCVVALSPLLDGSGLATMCVCLLYVITPHASYKKVWVCFQLQNTERHCGALINCGDDLKSQ